MEELDDCIEDESFLRIEEQTLKENKETREERIECSNPVKFAIEV